MWRIKIDLLIALIPFILVWISLPKECHSTPRSTTDNVGLSSLQSRIGSMNFHQLNSLLRDAINYLNKADQQQQDQQEKVGPKIRYLVEPPYSGGLVKLRAIRSDFGDMAKVLQLYQLQELESKYGSKARPRFGKRTEVAQDNFLPPYGYNSADEDNGVIGGAKVSPSFSFQPEDDEEEGQDGR